jgi:hypothetical protein
MRTRRTAPLVPCLLGTLLGLGTGCGKAPQAPPAARSRDQRGATPQETVDLVRQSLERRRYRDVLLHVLEDDRALFVLGRLQALIAFTEGLGEEDAERKALLKRGLERLQQQHRITDQALALDHESGLAHVDLGSLMDGLGALGATASVDGLGGFADLVPTLRDVTVQGDEASGYAGEPGAPERWLFRRVAGGWYYVAREP